MKKEIVKKQTEKMLTAMKKLINRTLNIIKIYIK